MSEASKVLVVDDSAIVRIKLKRAGEALGHDVTVVESGQAAIEMLAEERFDLVLLDIVMPEMDGFEVLGRLKSSTATRDIPVIVISALDEETTSVVRAIELGAEDFLPKDFEFAVLKARVSTCIARKRLRDVERDYFQQVSKLTRAASALEVGRFNPEKLGLQGVAERTDGLGKLAGIFASMAQTVYERERALRRKIRTFRGGLLLLVVGCLWGLVVPLSKMAAIVEENPVGLALLVNLITAPICIGWCLARGTMPRLSTIEKPVWTFVLLYAALGTLVNRLLIYWLTIQLPAFVVSIVIVLEAFCVFVFAALMRTETASAKRFLGLGIGLVGIVVMMTFGQAFELDGNLFWFVVAMIVPLSYAIEDIYVAERKPIEIDSVALYGLSLVASVVMLVPIAMFLDAFIPLRLLVGQLGVIVVLMAAAATLAMPLEWVLIETAGAVFASQAAYAVTAAGIGWSILLLGETIPLMTWASLALIVVGLIMVEPKREAEEEPPFVDEEPDDLLSAAAD